MWHIFPALVSGVARVLRAPVQRHVMGPLVTKWLRNSFAFCSYNRPAGQWLSGRRQIFLFCDLKMAYFGEF